MWIRTFVMQFDVKDALVSKGQGAVKTATFNIPKLNYQKQRRMKSKLQYICFAFILNPRVLLGYMVFWHIYSRVTTASIVSWH